MARTLYLIETRARQAYRCHGCGQDIRRGEQHFRHDPYPQDRVFRGFTSSHWCARCISAAPAQKDPATGRLRVRPIHLAALRAGEITQPRVELVGVGRLISDRIGKDESLIFRISPDQFEELICDRLSAMGLDARRTGRVNTKDGGVDIVFWPTKKSMFPFLGAVQAKHHKEPSRREGPSSVRDFAGTLGGHPFNAGMLVTNTGFTPDAEWFAREKARLVRLRGLPDLRRWVADRFDDEDEWREIPKRIELCPGVTIDLNCSQRVRDDE